MMRRIMICTLVLCGCIVANAQQSQTSRCGRKWGQEYDQVLDGYFAHVRGNSPSAIVLRVYGAWSEYEIVLDPENSPGKLVRYVAAKPIWGNVYSLERPHLTIEQYVNQAEEVPFTKAEFTLSDERLRGLVSKARAIDTSICEHEPLRDVRGKPFIVKDAQRFEIIEEQGRVRADVTDADARLVSQNPALKSWGHDVLQATGQPQE